MTGAPPTPAFRAMRREDLARVLEIEQQSFPMPWSAQAFVTEIGNPAAVYLVAEVAESVVGYIGSWMVADEAHITTLGVDPALRRRGIGERLLAALLQEALRRGVRRVSLEVRAGNLAAQQLYGKYGFRPVSRRLRYYSDNDEDAVVMWVEDLRRPAQRALLDDRFAALARRYERSGY